MYKISRAALLFSGLNETEVTQSVIRMFTEKRYDEFGADVPKGYPVRAWEWIGVVVDFNVDKQTSIVVPADVSQVFTIATWMAERHPNLSFSAWQHLRDLAPVLKYYASGRPQWRVGHDDDLEVEWTIPSVLPIDTQPPEAVGLPMTPRAVESFLERPILPYDAFEGLSGHTWTKRAFIDRRSPLA